MALDTKIVIIDYGSGNIQSLANTISYLGYNPIISNDKKEILSADKLIFPGQGHFRQAIENFEKSNLKDTIIEAIENKIDFLGICLGLQILFEKSQEAPNIKGLGIIKGEVKKFENVKIPQIGWNKIKTTKLDKNLDNDYFYFVNSFYVVPEDKSIISSVCNYGVEFCASVKKDNLTAVQFHPEKSSNSGINFFKNWLK